MGQGGQDRNPRTGGAAWRGAYPAHERLVASARRRPELWRILGGLLLVATVALAANALLWGLLRRLMPGYWDAEALAGNRPGAMLVVLGGFIFVTLGVAVAARVLHDRRLRDVTGPPAEAARQFRQVLRLLLLLGAVVMVLPPYDMGAPLLPNLPLSRWLLLLPASLLAVLIQTSAEEILFRGYLQQQLAARFRAPLVWAGVPSLLFAAGHFMPDEAGANAPVVMAWAGLFGLLMADPTARAGTLGPAIAVHLFNNVTSMLVFSVPGSLNGLALYLLPYDLSDSQAMLPWLVVDFAAMVLAWLAARVAIGR